MLLLLHIFRKAFEFWLVPVSSLINQAALKSPSLVQDRNEQFRLQTAVKKYNKKGPLFMLFICL